MKLLKIFPQNLEKLPKSSGIYLFYEKDEPIYIGKAINIKERVKNHFFQPVHKDIFLISKTKKIGFVETDSEIEALLLEAEMIKKYQPKYNVVWRDDKNYFYLAIKKNKKNLPYLYITHQKKDNQTEYIGPFVEGSALKKTLKYLRKAFPFYTNASHSKQKCSWCHLNLCPGPNPGKKYNANIKRLKLILQGKKKRVLSAIKKEMIKLARQKKFEQAAEARDQFFALKKIMAHAKIINNKEGQNILEWQTVQKTLQSILKFSNSISKIECYDVSNIQGKSAVGSMIVFVNGEPDKKQYRKFKIKTKNEPNDIAMLREVLERRFKNNQWSYPQVILIDGGIAQLNMAVKIKNQKESSRNIRIISLAKGRQALFAEGRKKSIPLKKLPRAVYNLILHLDDQAHYFALSYHKFLRKKNIFIKN